MTIIMENQNVSNWEKEIYKISEKKISKWFGGKERLNIERLGFIRFKKMKLLP